MSSDPATGIEAGRVDLDPLAAEPTAWSQAAPSSSSDARWLLGLLQAGDSFYPTGSYAHSFGLEGLVQQNVVRDRSTLREFLFRSALPALRHTDLPLAAHAWHAFATPDWEKLRELSVLSSALRTSREARAASENIGRQRAELCATLHDSLLAQEFIRRAIAESWPFSAPISAALEGRVLGAPLSAVLVGVAYSSLAALISAAMKILRLGQNGAQSLLSEALAAMPPIIAAAENTPLNEIGWFNPWLDVASARHETADARMFIS